MKSNMEVDPRHGEPSVVSAHRVVELGAFATDNNNQDKESEKLVLAKSVAVDSFPMTPMNPAERAKYQFHCPICMFYFVEVFRTSCCKHSICVNCALSHIHQKLKEVR